MAAAAACRGSTTSGGHGQVANAVIPGVKGKSCAEVCTLTNYYKNCDASVSIYGKTKKATAAFKLVGIYYNYQCTGGSWNEEVKSKEEDIATGPFGYITYCCCRK